MENHRKLCFSSANEIDPLLLGRVSQGLYKRKGRFFQYPNNVRRSQRYETHGLVNDAMQAKVELR